MPDSFLRWPVFLVIFIIGIFVFSFLNFRNKNLDKVMSATTNGIYVSPMGLDTNSGTVDKPFKTISKGISVATPGTVIYIKPGTYKEKVTINSKKGNSANPIVLVGDTTDVTNYPIIDGGDVKFTGKTDSPAINIKNSSWIVLERLKIINSSKSSIFVDASHYVTIRRNVIDYHSYGVLLRNKSSHLLMEYNNVYQSYQRGTTWSKLKDSKWEGGAVTSFGGAGMNVIRNNYFHDQFNAIYLNRDVRVGNYYDANVFIYKNRFENIVDDPYEPETYAFNNHFFNNTLVNTHRMVSFAPEGKNTLIGPVYVYGNLQILNTDPTGEAKTGRINSALKLEIMNPSYKYGIHFFNNTVDVYSTSVNGYGIDVLNSTITNFYAYNNIFVNSKALFSNTKLNLKNSLFNNNISTGKIGYTKGVGNVSDVSQVFLSTNAEDYRLSKASSANSGSIEVALTKGFSSPVVVTKGESLGAYNLGESVFKRFPEPSYAVPDGGEDPSFPGNESWPSDSRGGVNPPSGVMGI